MEDFGFGQSRPASSTTPFGSPNIVDTVAQSYRSISQFRSSSPANDGLSQRQNNKVDSALLMRYKVEFSPDEPLTHLVAAHNRVALATKDKKIVLIDTKSNDQTLCDIGLYYGSRLAQIKIYRLFLDPTGKFLIISVALAADNQPYENLLHVKQLQSLQKIKNYLISAVAWNYPRPATCNRDNGLSTGTILLGTSKGLVLQAEFTHSDETRFFPLKTGPEQYVKEIFDVGSETGAITGVACHQIKNNNLATERSYIILLSTNNRLYRMVGNVPSNVEPPPLHLIITQNSTNYKDVPGKFNNSKLDLYHPSIQPNSLPTRFAWLTEPGVMTSELCDHLTACRTSFESNEDINIIQYNNQDDTSLMLTSSTPGGMSPQYGSFMGASHFNRPISMVVTNFHVIILMRHCIRAICILNNVTVYEEYFSRNYGDVQGMSKEPLKNLIYVYFKRAIFRYKISNENKNVWKIFLEQKRFDMAKVYSSNDEANYDRVICEEAQHHFKLRNYEQSAELFAKSKKPFEDVCLMFMEAKCKKALQKYVLIRLNNYEPDTIQFTMLLGWLLEILVSSISVLQTRLYNNEQAELDELHSELKKLLEGENVVSCLKQHPSLFYSIILNYANRNIYRRLAELIGDHESLIRDHICTREYDEAINVMRQARRADLFYAHGHLLMKHRPKQLVDALIDQSNMDPSKLISVLMQENPYYNKFCETIRYLEHCINDLCTEDEIIHNWLFDLYTRHRSEESLREFLRDEVALDRAQPCLNLMRCLMTCNEYNLTKTQVDIYSHMGLYDEAVELALKFDLELAKSVAKRVEPEDHQKRLWLAIAKKVMSEREADIEVAAELLSESKLLKIEDVLIFFPDYKTIDPIKSAVLQSLEEKRTELIAIRDGTYEMIAKEIRSEIKAFKGRYVKVRFGQKCDLCSINIMSRSHYLFPCGHLFHYDCIIKEMMAFDPQYKGIEDKLKQLAIHTTNQQQQQPKFPSSAKQQQPSRVADEEKIAKELYGITSSECIKCGSFLVNYIDRPPNIEEDGFQDNQY